MSDQGEEGKMQLADQKEERNRKATQTAYQLAFSEADKEAWEDIWGEDEDDHKPQPEWDFEAFKRLSPLLSSRVKELLSTQGQ